MGLAHDEAVAAVRERSMFNNDRWATLSEVVPILPDGAIVEIGVARGGVLGYFGLRLPGREIAGYCRFDKGTLGACDKDIGLVDGLCGSSPMSDVQDWLSTIGVRAELVDGDIRETLPEQNAPVALAMIDLNLYGPTMHAIKWFWSHAASGGIALVDDVDFPGVAAALKDCAIPWERAGYFAKIRKP